MIVDATLEPADPRVTAILRTVVGEPPYQRVDWDVLRASIVGDAAALLHRRVRQSWTMYVARWSRAAIPVGVAAGIAAGLFMMYDSGSAQNGSTGEVALSPSALLSTVNGVSPVTVLSASVKQPLLDDVLLDGAVQ